MLNYISWYSFPKLIIPVEWHGWLSLPSRRGAAVTDVIWFWHRGLLSSPFFCYPLFPLHSIQHSQPYLHRAAPPTSTILCNKCWPVFFFCMCVFKVSYESMPDLLISAFFPMHIDVVEPTERNENFDNSTKSSSQEPALATDLPLCSSCWG